MGTITIIESSGSDPGDETRAALAAADVIIAVDSHTQRKFTVFGLSPLETTVTLKKPSATHTVLVQIDSESGGLEKLASLVREVKKSR